MSRKTRNVAAPKSRTASSILAAQDEMGDMGVDNEIFHTDSLPQTGHDEALDDDQQVVRSASKALVASRQTLVQIQATLLKAGQRALARRIGSLAGRLAKMGIQETKAPDFQDKYSTKLLEEPAQDGTAIDDSNVPVPLQFYGTDAPSKDQTGPARRSSNRRSGQDREYGKDLDFADDTNFEDDPVPPVTRTRDPKMAARRANDEAPAPESRPTQPSAQPDSSKPKKGNPPIDSMTIKFRKEAASSRQADPLPQFKDRGHAILDAVDESEYEANEPEFHEALDELGTLESLADDVVTTGMEYANDEGSMDEPVPAMPMASGKTASRRSRPAKRRASAEVPTASAWNTLKSALRRASSAGGRWASGSWSTRTEDFGRTVDLNVNTEDESGAPLIASSVTFSLIRENPKTRVATIEVNDGIVHNETRELDLDARQASRYASEWAKASEEAAKNILSGK